MENSFTVKITRENGTTWTRATFAKTKEDALAYVVSKLNWREREAITEGESKVEVE